MEKTSQYHYYYRPEYGSESLLIEFISGAENENFVTDLLEAINEINPQLIGQADLWMNDEIIYTINSDHGQFTLSKDIWGFAFIMSNNQSCILKINNLLLMNNKFQKIEVDFDDYKLNRNSGS